MDLLTNASESIQVGVADYGVGSRPRVLSAVRNIYAGVLLLYKEALRRKSPPESNDSLIKAKIEPAPDGKGGVKFVGVGTKTVDSKQIRERFETLGIATDWPRLRNIAAARNDIEHYFPNATPDSLQSVIASAFAIIRTFCLNELKEDPRALLGKETWEAMLKVSEVYEEERKACDEALADVDWESDAVTHGVRQLRCSECGSDLLRPKTGASDRWDAILECRICSAKKEPEKFIPEAVDAAYEFETYLSFEDGAEPPLGECPECGKETFVMEEGRCAYCGEESERNCYRCGNRIPASEMGSSPMCGYCAHVTSKDD